MDSKRRALVFTAVGSSALPAVGAQAAPAAAGPTLVTISGAIGKSNRGALDPALDQLMVKQKVSFEKAWTVDAAALARLPAVTIQPTVEYDGKPHKLTGPTLASVVGTAGVAATAPVLLMLRALDGYVVGVSLEDAKRYRMIVATSIDGLPLPIGGLGPTWAVYDADRLPDFKDKPLKERFAICPWGLYHIEVKPT
jgi:hypothetical protein